MSDVHDEPDAGEGGAGAPPKPNESNHAPDLTKKYVGDGITVYWYAKRCIHDASCIRALPRVFNPRRRPWVDVSQAEAEAIADAVRRCPTGALEYVIEGEPEPTPAPTVKHNPGGPLYVRGDFTITDEEGNVIRQAKRAALCQCGKTKNPPFCDNSHRSS